MINALPTVSAVVREAVAKRQQNTQSSAQNDSRNKPVSKDFSVDCLFGANCGSIPLVEGIFVVLFNISPHVLISSHGRIVG